MEGTTVFTVVLVVVLVFGAIYLMDPTLFGLLGAKMPASAGSAASMQEEFQDGMGVSGQVGGEATGMMSASMGGAVGDMNGLGVTGGVSGNVAMGGGAGAEVMATPGTKVGFKNKEGFQSNENAGEDQAGMTMGNPNVAGAGGDVTAFDGPAQFGNAEAPAGCYPRDQLTPSELLPKDPNSVWAQQNPMGTGSLKGKNFLSAGALIGVNTVGQSMRNANLQLRSEPPNPQMPVSIFNVPTIEPDINRRPLEIG